MQKTGLIGFVMIAILMANCSKDGQRGSIQKDSSTEKAKAEEPQTENVKKAIECWQRIKGTSKENYSFEGKLDCAEKIQGYIDKKLVSWKDLPYKKSKFNDKFTELKISDAERRYYKLDETKFGETWRHYLDEAQANVDAIRDYVNKNDGIKWKEAFDKREGELIFSETEMEKHFRQFKVRHSIWCYETMEEFDIKQATECYDSVVAYIKDGTTNWAELAIPRRKLKKKYKDAMVRDAIDDFRSLLDPGRSSWSVEERAQNILNYINRGKLKWEDLPFGHWNVIARQRANE